MAAKPSALSAHLGFWLRFVSNHVSEAFAQKLEAKGVRVAEWVIMRELFDADRPPSELAERIGMTRGAISKLADRLVEKGFAGRQIGKDDRRYQTLSLTKAGRDLVPKLAALADENDAEFFGHLNKSEKAALEKLMRGVIAKRGLMAVPVG